MVRIGAFEAKTNLSKLLERVEAGEVVIITRHGKEVARLVPPLGTASKTGPVDAIAQWRNARRGIRLDGLSIRDLIEQGRH